MATWEEKLTEAREAYHALMTGTLAVDFTDQSGERVTYSRASAPQLAAYIRDLERQIAGQTRPVAATFTTSKGLT